MLQRQWHLPLRKLVLAMPITAAVVAVGAHLLTNLGWTECFLLGALLSPTDPVLSSSRRHEPPRPAADPPLAEPRVGAERRSRAAGGARAGDGDQRATPPTSSGGSSCSRTCSSGSRRVSCSVRSPRGCSRARSVSSKGIPGYQKSLYALGSAFAIYGVTELPPHGNGLIAVYVAAIVLGIRRPDIRSYFQQQAADLVEIVKIGVFVVFGSLLTLHGLFGDGWAAVGIVAIALLVARPLGVFTALLGTATDFVSTGVHGLVRAEGRLDDDFLAARARDAGHIRDPDLQHRRADGAVLGDRARGDRHPGGRVDRPSRGARRTRLRARASPTPFSDRRGRSRRRRAELPMIHPIRIVIRKTAMKPPMSGQYMGRNYRTATGILPGLRHAWSATCSFAEGNAHATCSRRSWRNTNRSWLGGRSPSGWAGRNVGHGPVSEIAHRWFWRKKQSSQRALPDPGRPMAIPYLNPSNFDPVPTPPERRLAPNEHADHQSGLHAMFAISISGKRNNFAKYGLAGSCGHYPASGS